MVWFISKILISAVLISYVSWLSGKKGELAGFLTALPLTSMLAIFCTNRLSSFCSLIGEFLIHL
jgi:hypothetical protein